MRTTTEGLIETLTETTKREIERKIEVEARAITELVIARQLQRLLVKVQDSPIENRLIVSFEIAKEETK